MLVRDPLGLAAPEADTQAVLSTDPALRALDMDGYFMPLPRSRSLSMGADRHLSVNTQRQWTDTAIARTIPVLLSLFSVVTLLAARLVRHRVPASRCLPMRNSARYTKRTLTFGDTLAAARAHWGRWQPFRSKQVS